MSNPKQVFIRKYDGYTEASVGERLGWQKCDRHCECEERMLACPHEGTSRSDCDCVDGWTPPAELVERMAITVAKRWNSDVVLAKDRRIALDLALEQARWIGEQE